MDRKLRTHEMKRKSLDEFRKAQKSGLTLILDNVRSAHNVGSLFRTADAFLASSIHLCGYTPRPPHSDLEKTALGATSSIHWASHDSAAKCIDQLKPEHCVVGLEITENAIPLDKFSWPGKPIALVLGNEVSGISSEVLAKCDICVEIPQLGTKHSLNVAISAAIFIWQHYTIKKGGI